MNGNDEGIEIWEQANDELFYHTTTEKIIGIFQKDFTREIYEKSQKT